MLGSIQETNHAGLDQVIHLHIGRHAADQVIGNAFDQVRIFQDQLLLGNLANRHVRFCVFAYCVLALIAIPSRD
jgi:hypothetical protein